VLEALGKRTGPEDTRTAGQRRHDALEEACRRLIAAGLLPGRAGQSRQLMVHITLAQLLGMPTALPNLVLLCSFHHLTVIHRWGWTLTLHPDGGTTAVSPDGARTLHSHGPPGQAA
jgi:hypothetical protein